MSPLHPSAPLHCHLPVNNNSSDLRVQEVGSVHSGDFHARNPLLPPATHLPLQNTPTVPRDTFPQHKANFTTPLGTILSCCQGKMSFLHNEFNFSGLPPHSGHISQLLTSPNMPHPSSSGSAPAYNAVSLFSSYQPAHPAKASSKSPLSSSRDIACILRIPRHAVPPPGQPI